MTKLRTSSAMAHGCAAKNGARGRTRLARLTATHWLLPMLLIALFLYGSAATAGVRESGWLEKLPEGDPSGSFAPPIATKKLDLAHEIRNAISAKNEVRAELTIGPKSAVQLSYALVCEGRPRCTGSGEFTVEILDSAKSSQKHVFKAQAPEKWNVSQIDLSGLATQRVTLRLTATVSAEKGTMHPFWGEPLLLAPPAKPSPNVILISIDTLRADRLGCHGHKRDTSPSLDALAADGVRFDKAISQAPWTTPSHISLFTSQYPSTHRVNEPFRKLQSFLLGKRTYRTLGKSTETLTEILRNQGYRTVALAGGGTVAGILGFDHGFDVFADGISRHLTPEAWSNLSSWLTTLRDTPFFLFFHTFEVHAPYLHDRFAKELLSTEEAQLLTEYLSEAHPDPIGSLRNFLKAHALFRPEITSALYDGGIRYTDDFIGRLIAELRELGLYDRTLIVVTSDHGEEFADHSKSRFYDAHCENLYDELIHVPLILRMPGRFTSGKVVGEQVRIVDVAPTILELVGLQPTKAMQGQSLIGLMDGEPGGHDGWAVSEATCIGPEWKSLRSNETKYMVAGQPAKGDRSGPVGKKVLEQLFDLTTDPREQQDLLLQQPEKVREASRILTERLDAYRGTPNTTSQSTEIGEDVRERLRALGYLD